MISDIRFCPDISHFHTVTRHPLFPCIYLRGGKVREGWLQNTAGPQQQLLTQSFSASVVNRYCGLAIVGSQSCAEYHYLTDKDTVQLSDGGYPAYDTATQLSSQPSHRHTSQQLHVCEEELNRRRKKKITNRLVYRVTARLKLFIPKNV